MIPPTIQDSQASVESLETSDSEAKDTATPSSPSTTEPSETKQKTKTTKPTATKPTKNDDVIGNGFDKEVANVETPDADEVKFHRHKKLRKFTYKTKTQRITYYINQSLKIPLINITSDLFTERQITQKILPKKKTLISTSFWNIFFLCCITQ